MKYFKLFEKFKKEASSDDIFGKYIFADQRIGMKNLEFNTDTEEHLFNDLNRHYGLKLNSLDKWYETLKELKREGKYKNFINPPKGKVYRIISNLTINKMSYLLNINESEIKKYQNKYSSLKNINIIPRKNVQSWTTELNHKLIDGINFKLTPSRGFIILEADTYKYKNDFYINPEFTKKLKNLPDWIKHENEVISYGKIFCDKVYFWFPPDEKYAKIHNITSFNIYSIFHGIVDYINSTK